MTTHEPLDELADQLVPLLAKSCPPGADGWGGSFDADLGLVDAVVDGLEPDLVRSALCRAAGLLGWRVESVVYAGTRVAVRDIRVPPSPFNEVVEADMARRKREAVMFVSGVVRAREAGGTAPEPPALFS